MDFNKFLSGASDFARAMSPGARILAAGSLAIVVASGVWLFGQQANDPDTYLMGGETFSATQLRDMQGAFGKAGLEGYRIEAARVCVPRGQQSKYMAALADEDALPEDFGESLKKVVSANNFFSFGAQQEAQTKVATQGELQRFISRMKGIEKAFVHIAEETTRSFPQTKIVTASVGIEPRDNQAIDEATVDAIRSFVASAWAGLKPEAVTVVDLGSNRLFAGSGGETKPASPASDYARQKKQIELDWQTKIARALAIPGALVTANVELDAAGRRASEVSLAVAVPQAYYEQIWRKRSHAKSGTSPDPAELAEVQASEQRKIEAAVLPLMAPLAGKANRAPRVAVSTIHASTYTSTPAPPAVPAAAPHVQDRALVWVTQNWQPLGMGGLILVGLMVLRSTIKSAPVPAEGVGATVDLSSTLLGADDEGEPSFAPRASTPLKPPLVPTETLREELADAVRLDPRAAASVIRSWIGSAS